MFSTNTSDKYYKITNVDIESSSVTLWGCGDFNAIDLVVFRIPTITNVAPISSSVITG